MFYFLLLFFTSNNTKCISHEKHMNILSVTLACTACIVIYMIYIDVCNTGKVYYTLNLSKKQMKKGGEFIIKVKRFVPCKEHNKEMKICYFCTNGYVKVNLFFSRYFGCIHCNKTTVICRKCSNQNRVLEESEILVTVPPNAQHNQSILIKKGGNVKMNYPHPGHLLVTLNQVG